MSFYFAPKLGILLSRFLRMQNYRLHTINNKSNETSRTKEVNNDDIIARARTMQPNVQQHWLKGFIGQSFKFYGEDRLGLVADIILKFEKITKLELSKTILVGDVTFNDKTILGDGIIIDFTKNRIFYHERGARYTYNLEIDNRSAALWNKLLEQIKMALNYRK